MSNTLSIVLKTVERCNINCTYCYFFNGKDTTYKEHPPYIGESTIHFLGKFLKKSISEFKIKSVIISFHGGEPMMQNIESFDKMCLILKNACKDNAKIYFNIQTNGMLISKKWISIFKKYNVHVGISIDGPKFYHDKYRIDKKGKGTYERVINGINLYNELCSPNKLAALCVINPHYDIEKVYNHLAHELKFSEIDFLIPDHTLEDDYFDNDIMGNYLSSLSKEWTKDKTVKLRIVYSTLNTLLGNNSFIYGVGPNKIDNLPLLTISSNGDISPTDELRSCDTKLMNTNLNVKNSTLSECLIHPSFIKLRDAMKNSPDKCLDCCWNKTCHGGSIVNRYSNKNGFNNPSVYCNALKKFYSVISKYLIDSGLSYDRLKSNLGL